MLQMAFPNQRNNSLTWFSQFGTVVNNKDLFPKASTLIFYKQPQNVEFRRGKKKSHVQKNVEYPDVVNSVPGSLAGIRTHLWHQTLPPAQKHKGENKQLAPQTFMRIHSFWWANLRWRGAGGGMYMDADIRWHSEKKVLDPEAMKLEFWSKFCH